MKILETTTLARAAVLQTSLATLHGIGIDKIDSFDQNRPLDKSICKPSILRGKIAKFDKTAALCAIAANDLYEKCSSEDKNPRRIGCVIAKKNIYTDISTEYVKDFQKEFYSPSKYAASAPNLNTGIIAMTTGISGPSMTLTGKNANIADALLIGSTYIMRDDADVMLVGEVCLSETQDNFGVCSLFAIQAPTTSPYATITLSNQLALTHNSTLDVLNKVPHDVAYIKRTLTLHALLANNSTKNVQTSILFNEAIVAKTIDFDSCPT